MSVDFENKTRKLLNSGQPQRRFNADSMSRARWDTIFVNVEPICPIRRATLDKQ